MKNTLFYFLLNSFEQTTALCSVMDWQGSNKYRDSAGHYGCTDMIHRTAWVSVSEWVWVWVKCMSAHESRGKKKWWGQAWLSEWNERCLVICSSFSMEMCVWKAEEEKKHSRLINQSSCNSVRVEHVASISVVCSGPPLLLHRPAASDGKNTAISTRFHMVLSSGHKTIIIQLNNFSFEHPRGKTEAGASSFVHVCVCVCS